MSAWRLAVRELYERGPLRTGQVLAADYAELRKAEGYGLVRRESSGRGLDALWLLTDRGVLMAEGRLAFAVPYVPSGGLGRAHGSKLRPMATWLTALPLPNHVRTVGACGCAVCVMAA